MTLIRKEISYKLSEKKNYLISIVIELKKKIIYNKLLLSTWRIKKNKYRIITRNSRRNKIGR